MWNVKICMENGGRIEFIRHESFNIPTVIEESLQSWLLVIDSKNNGNQNRYLLSSIIAFSCWHPVHKND